MSTKQERAQGQGTKAVRKDAPGTGSMAHRDEMVASAMARDAFSRERYEFLLRTIFVLFALLGLSLAANVVYGMRETKLRYFAVDPEGGIREVIALDRPIQNITQVRSWSTDAVVSALTLNFANYQQQLAETKLSFTDSGWKSFEEALKRSKVLDTVIGQQLVTYVVPAGAPVVSRQGVVEGGKYGWVLEMPIIITYESSSLRQSQNYSVSATVVRRPESENPSGLGIAQMIVR